MGNTDSHKLVVPFSVGAPAVVKFVISHAVGPKNYDVVDNGVVRTVNFNERGMPEQDPLRVTNCKTIVKSIREYSTAKSSLCGFDGSS